MWIYKIKMVDSDNWVEINHITFNKYFVSGARQVKRVWLELTNMTSINTDSTATMQRKLNNYYTRGRQ